MAYVALDYGHGSDTYQTTGGKGVRRNGRVYEEHDFNADVGEQVRKILEDHGVNVLVTQPPNSRDVGLSHRVNLANRRGVDLFFSIHANAGTSSVNGACVFAWEGYSGANKVADLTVKYYKEAGIELHGNGRHYSKFGSWTNFYVLRNTDMSAVLAEHGFMTGDEDFENIFGKNKKEYRRKCAIADAKAILDYFNIRFKGFEPTVKKVRDYDNKEIEVVYEGSDGVNFYSKADWNANPYGAFKKGTKRKLLAKFNVDGSGMYEILGNDDKKYYITAYEDFVRVNSVYSVVSNKTSQEELNMKETGFKDVAKDEYYTKAIKYLDDQNILKGYPDGNFGVGDNLKREDFAVALYRALTDDK